MQTLKTLSRLIPTPSIVCRKNKYVVPLLACTCMCSFLAEKHRDINGKIVTIECKYDPEKTEFANLYEQMMGRSFADPVPDPE